MRLFSLMTGALLYASGGFALPSVVPDPIPCYQELSTHFFDPLIVNQALSLYGVRQELWQPIIQTLQGKSLTVPDRMKQRTAFMVPNPIEYPMNRVDTAKLLKSVLAEVFYEALQANYISPFNSNEIFEYIFSQQLPAFNQCFGVSSRSR